MAPPPSSPRLPSPPPPAEIQIGPNSPAEGQNHMEQQMEQSMLHANAKRRIHPGTRASDFAAGPPLIPLNELDSAFQLQEHLSALHYFHTANNTQPITRETALMLAQPPPNTDRTLWLYELCRFLIAQCNGLIVGFLFDAPPCSKATCPEMRASEWQFLCAVHEQPKSCCAIDYCCHTLDWAANVVTNPKIFPSRFVFADAHDKNAAVKNLINVFRRLHRIFAHAWFQHRGVFWAVEGQTGLYILFKAVCDMYDLLRGENYKLPPEAEGLDTTPLAPYGHGTNGDDYAFDAATNASGANGVHSAVGSVPGENVPGVLSLASLDRKGGSHPLTNGASAASASGPGARRSGGATGQHGFGLGFGSGDHGSDLNDDEHLHAAARTNTRRHIRSSPSTGSAVTTVMEQDEDIPAVPSVPRTPLTAHVASPPSITVRESTGEDGDDGDDTGSVSDSGTEVTEVPVTMEDDWTAPSDASVSTSVGMEVPDVGGESDDGGAADVEADESREEGETEEEKEAATSEEAKDSDDSQSAGASLGDTESAEEVAVTSDSEKVAIVLAEAETSEAEEAEEAEEAKEKEADEKEDAKPKESTLKESASED